MLSKTQKIWLWVSGLLFLIPEILWSPVSNFIFIFLDNKDPATPLRLNFLTDGNPGSLYRTVLVAQLVGLLGFLFVLVKNNKNLAKRWAYYIVLIINLILILLTFFVFYMITFFSMNIG